MNKFMLKAIELASIGATNTKGGPFGAVIVKNNEIVGQGYNQVTSTCDPTAHAEIVAIRDACKKLNTFHLENCEIYTNCEPCPMCLGAIYWAHIRKIYYAVSRYDAAKIGFDDAFIYEEFAKDLGQRQYPLTQVIVPQALKPFEIWYTMENKINY